MPEQLLGFSGIYSGLNASNAHGALNLPAACSLVVAFIYAHNESEVPDIPVATSNFVNPFTLAGSTVAVQDGQFQRASAFWILSNQFSNDFQAAFTVNSDWVAFLITYKNAVSVGALSSTNSGDTSPVTIGTGTGPLGTVFFGLAGTLAAFSLPNFTTHFEAAGNSAATTSHAGPHTFTYPFFLPPKPWLALAVPIL